MFNKEYERNVFRIMWMDNHRKALEYEGFLTHTLFSWKQLLAGHWEVLAIFISIDISGRRAAGTPSLP